MYIPFLTYTALYTTTHAFHIHTVCVTSPPTFLSSALETSSLSVIPPPLLPDELTGRGILEAIVFPQEIPASSS